MEWQDRRLEWRWDGTPVPVGAARVTAVQVIHPAQAPPRSKAEMVALAALPGIEASEVPVGKLGLHEEQPDPVAPLIEGFLRRYLPPG